MACIALATLSAAQTNGAHRDVEGPREVDGVRGDWLDEDGIVLPQYRDKVAAARRAHPHSMSPIGEAMTIAQRRAPNV